MLAMTALTQKILIALTVLIICFAVVLLINTGAISANAEDRATITVSGRKITAGSTFNISMSISNNKGISNLRLNLIYDDSVMTLTDVQQGQALSSLEFLTTNTSTEDGYGIKPFRLMWDDVVNDNSNGTIATLTFRVSEEAAHGSYTVSLDYGDGDISYIDGITLTVADISIAEGTVIIANESEIDDEDKPTAMLIVLPSVGGAVILAAVLFFIARSRIAKIT